MYTTAARTGVKPTPVCKAILMCDQTIYDVGTGKPSLIGIFDKLYAPSFPETMRPFTIFLQLVDGIGTYEINVELQDVAKDSAIVRLGPLKIEHAGRHAVVNVTFPVPQIVLPHTGRYLFIVYANGQLIEQQVLEAVSSLIQP